jgi:hypothetical protein
MKQNTTKLNPAEFERRKMFESRNYRQKVKRLIELQSNLKLEKLTAKEKEVAKYFAEPMNVSSRRQGEGENKNESLDKVLKETVRM